MQSQHSLRFGVRPGQGIEFPHDFSQSIQHHDLHSRGPEPKQ